ncbi:chemotaxis protein CheA [Vibrio europaeus]|uniref:Chemotaxis protein CheA n=1 Tax=Vibrio europaeus TaxID=300876 RepID=A0AAE7B069_9VIBR|nr:chemotaxis protein CheA [Vibrio europaeus]MDC5805540.1 chemotaxis protein CheA [Vibrio europaeus]MDC5811154.1 chemotaxis protein CheA [Vibrio europaeus]MDC5826385.1 chemotaxis protein CheA [Vibrio europaeus]MDC5831751.1 chemotaxis protein CheA [Vibrio europaeus]MDC5834706.1 chemotaxis protein CheA [Vibrio europaeus]
MALDMEQLRKMFYEECRENLEVLEDVLLNLDPTQVEEESINTIFRAAHSIKGGAGTFNLLDISEFTHNVEAYLDLVRNNERSLSAETIDLLLKSGDCIHSMLEGHELGNEVNVALKEEVGLKLAELLGEAPTDTADVQPEQNQEATSSNSNQPWSITFSPHPEMFFSGNDPLRILRELKDLDESCQIIADTTKLPEIDDIEAELCFLSWTAELDSSVEEAQIQEVFEWVEDECDLTIEKASAPQAEDASSDIVENAAEQTKAESVESAASEVANTAKSKEPNKSTKVAKSDSNVSSIRVDIDKVDSLINLVGELVITQSMLTEIGNDFTIEKLEKLKTGLDQLLQNSKDLQENVLNIRMLPMSFAFSRFPRLVRDLSSRLDKQVDLQIKGEQTELDKTVLERIVDPLVHLVRNGIDHGIEQPQQRLDAGKSEMGTIGLNAYHQGGSIVIEIKDDGAGLNCDKLWNKALEKGVLAAESRREEYSDKQIMNLIFAPGFSTAEEVSDISGRGVGMDVVRRNIEELGGHIEVESALGEGSCFTISLPLTLAILDGQLVRVGGEVYVIPLLTIVESIQIDPNCIKLASGGIELYRLREENIPILRLQDELEMGNSEGLEQRILCFVEAAGNRVGLLLDELLDQQQVVIKSLESNYSKVAGISGATILGDGSVSLILDIQGLITNFLKKASETTHKGVAA